MVGPASSWYLIFAHNIASVGSYRLRIENTNKLPGAGRSLELSLRVVAKDGRSIRYTGRGQDHSISSESTADSDEEGESDSDTSEEEEIGGLPFGIDALTLSSSDDDSDADLSNEGSATRKIKKKRKSLRPKQGVRVETANSQGSSDSEVDSEGGLVPLIFDRKTAISLAQSKDFISGSSKSAVSVVDDSVWTEEFVVDSESSPATVSIELKSTVQLGTTTLKGSIDRVSDRPLPLPFPSSLQVCEGIGGNSKVGSLSLKRRDAWARGVEEELESPVKREDILSDSSTPERPGTSSRIISPAKDADSGVVLWHMDGEPFVRGHKRFFTADISPGRYCVLVAAQRESSTGGLIRKCMAVSLNVCWPSGERVQGVTDMSEEDMEDDEWTQQSCESERHMVSAYFTIPDNVEPRARMSLMVRGRLHVGMVKVTATVARVFASKSTKELVSKLRRRNIPPPLKKEVFEGSDLLLPHAKPPSIRPRSSSGSSVRDLEPVVDPRSKRFRRTRSASPLDWSNGSEGLPLPSPSPRFLQPLPPSAPPPGVPMRRARGHHL